MCKGQGHVTKYRHDPETGELSAVGEVTCYYCRGEGHVTVPINSEDTWKELRRLQVEIERLWDYVRRHP
jgi:DnaJ-class molecular chaperone